MFVCLSAPSVFQLTTLVMINVVDLLVEKGLAVYSMWLFSAMAILSTFLAGKHIW